MKRDCTCPRARHHHGTRKAYIRDRCRCTPCRRANSTYSKQQKRRQAHNAWNGRSEIIDSTGTRRRLQALAALGWTLPQIAEHMGSSRDAVYQLRRYPSTTCYTRTAERVTAVYNQLAWTPPPPSRHASYVRNKARRLGWAAPAAWDDIDNPNERPQGALRMVRRAA